MGNIICEGPVKSERNNNHHELSSSSSTYSNNDNDGSDCDWTTVDWKWSNQHNDHNNYNNILEPTAEWYYDKNNPKKQKQQEQVSDLFFDVGTMNAAKFANTKTSPNVNVR